jgi:tetratricopeptide (TPR) repeat protein
MLRSYIILLRFFSKDYSLQCSCVVAFKAGRLEEALEWYGAAVRRTAGCPVALCNRSLVHAKLKNFQSALEDANEALSVLKSSPETAEGTKAQAAGVDKAHFRKASILFPAQKGLDRKKNTAISAL